MPALKLTSYGAAAEVTGSCHLLQYGTYRLLIDCGWFQGSAANYQKNAEAFAFDPKKIQAVILTHAHLDHCGRLPLLIRGGFRGPVYSTAATRDLAHIILEDNLRLMRENVKKHKIPNLYNQAHLQKLYQYWQTVDYYQQKILNKQLNFTLHNAGHILGAATISIRADDKTVVFSGDLGAEDMPLVKNVDYLDKADYVIMESTYGDRQHEHLAKRNQLLLQNVQKTTLKNSTLLISVFAVERSQDILRVLNDYYETHLDFRVPVYLDSPMANQATAIYRRYRQLLNDRAQDDLRHDRDIFDFPHLKITSQIRQSQKINHAPNPKIILAGSGMAEGGRILHHLVRYAPNPKNSILFMGFQVPGTLGHHLLNGAFDFNYYGQSVPVRANVEQIGAFSAHADQTALLKWLGHFSPAPKVLLSHGDKEVMAILAKKITQQLNYSCQILLPAKILELN